MAEETRRRRARSRKAVSNGTSIQWPLVVAALGPARARQWQRELQQAAQAQAEAAQAILKSFDDLVPEQTAKSPRRRTRRKITDPVQLENRRKALAMAREARAARRREETEEIPDRELTAETATG